MKLEELRIIIEAVQKRDWTEVMKLAKAAMEQETDGGAGGSKLEERVRSFELTAKEFG